MPLGLVAVRSTTPTIAASVLPTLCARAQKFVFISGAVGTAFLRTTGGASRLASVQNYGAESLDCGFSLRSARLWKSCFCCQQSSGELEGAS